MIALQRVEKGILVDDLATGDVDQHAALLHRGKTGVVEQALITPHVSNGSDENRHGGVDVFCDNLRAYRDGRPLRNVIDWQRGY
jgi:hypothetical protein